MDTYHTLFSGAGIPFLNEGCKIQLEAYPNVHSPFAFDLALDLSTNDCSHCNSIKHGSVRIDVRFDDFFTSAINCIVNAEHDNILQIDAARQVIVDLGG